MVVQLGNLLCPVLQALLLIFLFSPIGVPFRKPRPNLAQLDLIAKRINTISKVENLFIYIIII